jgi:hypothetical protein
LPGLQFVIVRQSFDVFGIVQQSFPLSLNMSGVVLTKALKAWSLKRSCVSPPISGRELTQAVLSSADTAVYDRNEMAIRNKV